MNTQISTFNFKSNPVRIEIIKNEPYFCLADVCLVMNIQNSRRVNADMLNQEGVRKAYIPTTSGNQELTFINEPNLYRIIFKSRKAEAVEFQNWVFEEVLPQIRKTGKYASPTLQQPDPLREIISKEMPVEHWLLLASMWYSLHHSVDLLDKLKTPLEKLGSAYAPQVYGCATEYQTTLGVLKRILAPILEDVDVPQDKIHYRRALEALRNYKPRGLSAIAII